METAGILSLVGLLALLVLTILADVAMKITTNPAGTDTATTGDHVADTSDMIAVGDAQFTAEQYARLVELHLTYHITPTTTTGGDA